MSAEEVVPPMKAKVQLAAHVPQHELYPAMLQRLCLKPAAWKRRDNPPKQNSRKHGGFARVIQPTNQDANIFVTLPKGKLISHDERI
jgi:hypothetical protein